MFAALLLLACTEVPDLGPRPRGADSADTARIALDTGPEHVPAGEETRDDALFSLARVHEIRIVLSDEALASLGADPYTYVQGDLLIDGDRFDGVGVRIKGRLGSYRDLDHKSAFKIDADAFVPGMHIYGREKLNLNNMVQDATQTHERIAYTVYNLAGVPAPRVGYAWVTVNDSTFGLYSLVEAYDRVFLEERFEEGDGNLYDGDYVWYPDGSYTKLDFQSGLDELMELDEGQDVGHADVKAVTAALDAAGTEGFTPSVGAVADLDHHVRMWATEVWVGQYDGYTYNQNNYRVYFAPADGLARLLPWDHDWAFSDSTPLTSPYGRLSQGCKADADCHARFLDALADVEDLADAADLPAELDRMTALIDPYVEEDPRKETDAATIESNQAAFRAWLQGRSASLRAMAGL